MMHDVDNKMALAAELHRQNKMMEAEAIYIELLRVDPNHYNALFQLGLLYGDMQNFDRAITVLEQAIRLRPQSMDAQFAIGLMLFNAQRYEEAVTAIHKILILQPDHVQSLHILGLIAYSTKRYEEAQRYVEKALSKSPDNISILNNYGLILKDLKKYTEALAIYQKALALQPDVESLLYNKFIVLYELKQYEEALKCVEKVLQKEPDNVKMLNCKADCLMHLKRTDDMMEYYKKIVELDNHNHRVCSELLYNLMCVWEWPEAYLHIKDVRDMVTQPIVTDEDVIMPLIGHALPGFTLQDHYDLSHRYANYISAEMSEIKQKISFSFTKQKKHKLKIGYISLDFRIHPLGQLIPEVLELHNRDQVTVYAYSYGPNDKSGMRKRIEEAVDHFVDVELFDDEAIAKQIYSDGIDILVDLTGYSWASRTRLLALRPAPIQASYLGYLGTMAADFIDALIADQFVIPPENRQFYSEKIYDLPCYQANDRQCAIATKRTRTACGLPEDALVFCCFNQVFKITPDIFEVWCKLLAHVPNSVLWLLASNVRAVHNLRKQVKQRGLNPDRLVFANIIPLDEHLARLQCADIMLDTHTYNAGTTSSNALWAGVPVVTYSGETFASRMAGSLLTALGVPELITYSIDDYYQLALTLASDHEKRRVMAEKIKMNRASSILFDTPFLAQHLEGLYFNMWSDYINDKIN